ncbi:MAG: DUF3570 domain-containing protein [Gammaproteobacteria bacterium]|nr:MAG: DUF3570 domain-containing protein [Gammaproteobacteria bacterium]
MTGTSIRIPWICVTAGRSAAAIISNRTSAITPSHTPSFIGPVSTGGSALPSYASADYRLGEFDAITVGLKYGWETAFGNEWSARLEFYATDGKVPGSLLVGDQAGREIYPDLEAIIAQISYRFGI